MKVMVSALRLYWTIADALHLCLPADEEKKTDPNGKQMGT